MNETIKTFGYPESCVKEYDNWVVLLRPKQVTLGSLVLAEKSAATSYGGISPEAMAEQRLAVMELEATLKSAFGPEKFNYLMLMMVDPNVHFHVIPRYSAAKAFDGQDFEDTGWPKLPDMASSHDVTDKTRNALLNHLQENWANF